MIEPGCILAVELFYNNINRYFLNSYPVLFKNCSCI